ncbi:MAG: alcohol dehydrogenase catalytic domain-containing protein [Fimbriimonadaceae bacterium]|nr:alcohol dehydrogenase catalytic domain-containing protein [Fimbriimonadaceae bacterium]
MRLARYLGGGQVEIADEEAPDCPEGGLLVRTEACGLCSGELMDWYMDRKVPHVLGHEVAGRVAESDDPRFPVGARVFPHHHAPCLTCDACRRGRYVHCLQWKRTRLVPGGMAECFAVPKENLNDALIVDDLAGTDAALIEPLATVVKSVSASGATAEDACAVVGLGAMGVLHALVAPGRTVGYETNPARREWARERGIEAREPSDASPADTVFVCPGSEAALRFALEIVNPGGTIVLFAPLPPGRPVTLDLEALYFRDFRLVSSYSCGPTDTKRAAEIIRQGTIRADQIVSTFVELDELPSAYLAMKSGETLKAMVVFS